ncbi:MAG TPA: TolC family protein [Puia sp.]|nr:TolC family protein [Puia sp.]
MSKQFLRVLSWALLLGWPTGQAMAQALTLRQAVQTALNNYGTIRAKTDYVKAARANIKEVKNEYLPDLNLAAEQVYGTANASYGPAIGYKAPAVSSSGPTLPSQNWNAAFGSLYWTNINWDFFQFGRYKQKAQVAQKGLDLNQSDLDQEKFEQSVRVGGAFLNLIAAQKLILSQQANLDRAVSFQTVVTARAKSGLNPGVDSSLANAEVSSARIALTNAIEAEQEYANELAQLMQVRPPDSNNYSLDSAFVSRLPNALNASPAQQLANHPLLQFFQQRVLLSDQQAKYLRTLNYPTFSLFGVVQDKGTGFDYNYGAQYPNAYTPNYFKGVGFQTANYLIGVGVTWDITTPLRVRQQVAAQQFTTEGLREEYGLISQELQAQVILADTKIRNALANYREAPIQVKAAADAYLQKETLYKNGLATIVDVTTAAAILNQAETERDVIDTNVWQALLYKAASTGDFALFFNEF